MPTKVKNNIGPIITVITLIVGASIAFAQVKVTSEDNKVKVSKVESKIEEHDEQIQEIEKYGIRQSMLMERQSMILDKLEKKLDNQE